MYPALRPGDTLVLEVAAADDCAPGDIVCLAREHGYTAHRIITIDRGADHPRIVTKGDSLPRPDPPVPVPSGGIPRVVMVSRDARRLIRPRRKKLTALLSRANLTTGVVRGRIAGIVRSARARLLSLFGWGITPP